MIFLIFLIHQGYAAFSITKFSKNLKEISIAYKYFDSKIVFSFINIIFQSLKPNLYSIYLPFLLNFMNEIIIIFPTNFSYLVNNILSKLIH
jgi:hypothetical protein